MSESIQSEFKQMIDELEVDLKSSVTGWSKTKYVTKIYHFVGGVKRTYNGINIKTIRQGQFTKFLCKNGAMVMVNDSNVLMVETFEEE